MILRSYGLGSDANYQATQIHSDVDGTTSFDMLYHNDQTEPTLLGKGLLQIPGTHNVLNSLAALAVIHSLGLSLPDAIQALAKFSGTERRFDVVGSVNGITLINDYAHHPTQITTTIAAARSRYPAARIWVVWEPHTYSRTSALEQDFIASLDGADKVIITQIYAAREADTGYLPIPIVDALGSLKAAYIPDFDQVVAFLDQNLAANDVVLVLSAGNAPEITQKTLTALTNRQDGLELKS